MLKITHLLLLTAIVGNVLTINAMDPYKNTIIVLPDLTGSQSSLDLNAVFDLKQYQIITLHKTMTPFKWLTDYQYTQKIDKKIEEIENAKVNPYSQIIFFASKSITPFALHYIAQNPTKINGVLLDNPTYDPYYPISDISKKSITNKPIIMITDAFNSHYNDSKTIYTSLATTKIDGSMSNDQTTMKNNNIYWLGHSASHNLIQTILEDPKNLTDDEQKTSQRKPMGQDIKSVVKVKQQEKTTYLVNCGLKLCGGGLLVYLIYNNWRS
jgi:hypothetical protein